MEITENRKLQVTVAVCTRNRQEMISRCLESLFQQKTEFLYEIICVENDAQQKSRKIVEAFSLVSTERNVPFRYFCHPEQNIALARNLAIQEARGDFLIFIDDDEWADPLWLQNMMEVQKKTDGDVILGTCIPVFSEDFSPWLKDCFLYRQEKFTSECQQVYGAPTNTTLYRLDMLRQRKPPLDPDFGRTGGSDVDLAMYLMGKGRKIYKTSLAKVYELQTKNRSRVFFHWERQFRAAVNNYRIVRKNCGRIMTVKYFFWSLAKNIFAIFHEMIYFYRPRQTMVNMVGSVCGCLGLIYACLGFQKRGYY
ncbi:MAG: glycosyltransferase family A protein [Planctomycetia bacterium]|nr:glycosyltransferase family A protein [Planctomycetia bacterium]